MKRDTASLVVATLRTGFLVAIAVILILVLFPAITAQAAGPRWTTYRFGLGARGEWATAVARTDVDLLQDLVSGSGGQGTVVVLGHDDGPIVSGDESRSGSTAHGPAPTTEWPGYDEPETAHRRRAARSLFPFVAIALAILAVGCGFGSSDTPKPISSAHGPLASSPALTAVPGGHASPVVGASIGPPTTTETEWGTIFDSLPASFPKLPGQEPADTGAGPTSGSFAANMSVADARKLMEVSLIALGWTVAVGSPLEDGTVVVEAAGAKAGCKAEVRLTPMSGTVIMSVLYGATCPFS